MGILKRVKDNRTNIFALLLAACAICQLMIIQYFNIFEAKEHLGIDSSWEYLKLSVISNEGGYFPKDLLSETTSPGTGKIFLIMAPINRLINNIWVSYGLGNLLITIFTIVILWCLMRRIEFDNITKLIVVNLFLCPYLANGYDIFNDLGYFSCGNGVPGYENMVILLLFLTLLILTYEKIEKRTVILILLTLVLFAYNGVSAGSSLIIFCGTPAVLYIMTKVFLKNDIKELVHWKSIFLCGINIATIIGAKIGSLAGLAYGDAAINWITAPEFFENIQHEFLAYMLLVGAVPKTGAYRRPTSLFGISYMFGLIIFVIIIVSVIYNFYRYIKGKLWMDNSEDIRLFCISTIVIITLEFALLNTRAGEDIFETRYLLTSLLSCFIFVGYFIKELNDKLLFKKFGVIVLFMSILGMDLFSDYILAITDNSSFKVEEIQSVIEETDAKLVYVWDDGIDLIPTYDIIRVTDTDRVYKGVKESNILLTYGQYKYFDDSTEYNGPTILVTNEGNTSLPKDVMKRYSQIAKIDDILIYYANNNLIDLSELTMRQTR